MNWVNLSNGLVERRQHSSAGSVAEAEHSSTEQAEVGVSTRRREARKDAEAGDSEGEAKNCRKIAAATAAVKGERVAVKMKGANLNTTRCQRGACVEK